MKEKKTFKMPFYLFVHCFVKHLQNEWMNEWGNEITDVTHILDSQGNSKQGCQVFHLINQV